jgi:alkylation response protein AidB-like acyl-CoA dehydrogenase
MDLTFQEDETQIAAMAAELLAAEADLSRWFAPTIDAGADEDRLRALAAGLGWIGFGAPEAVGGSAVSVVEEAVLFREVGRYLGPVSLVAGAVAARLTAQSDPALAAAIIAGDEPVGLAVPRAGGRLWRFGARSGSLALLAEGDGVSLVASDGWETTEGLDPTASAQAAARDTVRTLAKAEGRGEADRFRILAAAQQLGLSEAALGASVAYAKLREQFGRAIGSFQAVRHRCVDMAVRCERAKAQLWFAAVCLRDGASDASFQAAAAARVCDDAAGRNASDNIFLHGAIGVTAENSGHLFLKRSLLWRTLLNPHALLEDIASGAGPAS